MRKSRIAGLLVAVAALTAMVAVPAVSGASHRTDTKIRIAKSAPLLHGVLASKNEGCEVGRAVVVKRARPGRNKLVGVDYSSANGGWSVDINRLGKYIVHTDGFGVCGGDKKRIKIVR